MVAQFALTLEQKEYVPIAAVIDELESILSTKPQLDYITFSGAGEPTLNNKIGEVVEFIKNNYPEYRICLLTNGSLLGDTCVAASIANVDLVVPNLDASNAKEFAIINHPAQGLLFEDFVAGLINFCDNFKNRIFLELFIAPNINDSDSSIARFVDIVKQLKVDKVQLNSLDRPGCSELIQPATPQIVHKFIDALAPIVAVEAVGAYRYKGKFSTDTVDIDALCAAIQTICRRRQVTKADLIETLNVSPQALEQALNLLIANQNLKLYHAARGDFFGI